MDYNFTATVEQDFDVIADGKLGWQAMLGGFYTPFKTHLEEIRDGAARASGERILGKDPVTGLTVLVRMGKFGAVAQLGAPEELGENKPKYGNLKTGQNIETITFEDALQLFELPKDLGLHNGEMLTIGIGRFGPYIKYADKKFVSIPKGEEALSVTFERAVAIVTEKERADAPLGTYEGQGFTKGSGKFGPFIKWGSLYISIPKAYNPETITNEEAITLIKAKVEKENNRYIHNWEDAGIVVENGRWGPFIRYGKLNFKIEKNLHDTVADLTLVDIKGFMLEQNPEIFKAEEKKKAAPKKAAAPKVAAAKKK